MNAYILSQILALISNVILLTYSVIKVKRSTILCCNVVINFLLAVHYFLLNDYTGTFCSGVTSFMVCVFYFKKYMRKYTLLVPLLFVCVFVAIGVMTWNSMWSIIPVTGNILLVIALWNNNENVIKLIFIAVGLLWIILNIHLRSIVNVLGQTLAVASGLVYFIRNRKSVQPGIPDDRDSIS